jgi:hypothetical protein
MVCFGEDKLKRKCLILYFSSNKKEKETFTKEKERGKLSLPLREALKQVLFKEGWGEKPPLSTNLIRLQIR